MTRGGRSKTERILYRVGLWARHLKGGKRRVSRCDYACIFPVGDQKWQQKKMDSIAFRVGLRARHLKGGERRQTADVLVVLRAVRNQET